MKLGGSMRRRRGGGGSRRGGRKDRASSAAGRTRRKGSFGARLRLGITAAVVAVAAWGVGYAVATHILFPAPPPPANLVTVPDLRGQDVSEAEAKLVAAGFAPGGVDSLLYPTVPRGRVIGQSPLPGQMAVRGAEVRVTRSLGPQTRAVPDVRNVVAARALVVLETVGLLVGVDSMDSEVPRGRVVSTLPEGGSVVALPSEIRMTVSLGPARVVMPYLLGMEEGSATAVLDSLGLVVGSVEEVERDGLDAGIVVEQVPAADSLVERGSAVRLAVGKRGG